MGPPDGSKTSFLPRKLVLGPISSRSFIGGNYWTAPSKTPRFSSPWVGRGIGRTPWPLTGVRGFESGMARVCVSKGLSLERWSQAKYPVGREHIALVKDEPTLER